MQAPKGTFPQSWLDEGVPDDPQKGSFSPPKGQFLTTMLQGREGRAAVGLVGIDMPETSMHHKRTRRAAAGAAASLSLGVGVAVSHLRVVQG